MKIITGIKLNLRSKEAHDKVEKATGRALKNVVTDIANEAIQGSPKLTGNNARSIMFEVGPRGQIAKGKLEGAIYSTSGYGGFLETGTVKMAARPYFKPALDHNIHKLPASIKAELR